VNIGFVSVGVPVLFIHSKEVWVLLGLSFRDMYPVFVSTFIVVSVAMLLDSYFC
jgi:hypothetical protein